MLLMTTDATTTFILSQFLVSFIFHSLFMVIYVFAIPIMLIFRNMTFLKNAGFVPSIGNGCFYFSLQTILFFTYMGSIGLLFKSRYEAEDKSQTLSPTPIAVATCIAITRIFVISARHGITPANRMLRWCEKPIPLSDIKENLILLAWVKIDPEEVLQEI